MHPEIINSLAYIKKAAAITNCEAGLLDKKIAQAIVKACDEILGGKLHEDFIVDPIQGGAGTSLNMNANEVIANRANEILGGKKGDYSIVNPNDHVNCGQSTNDVIPTAGKMTSLRLLKNLKKELMKLHTALEKKAEEFDSVIKLLGVARNTPEGIEVGVYPVMIARDHPLASVRDSFNAVFIHGDAVDDAMFYGRGAGEMPTASAVVGDVIDEARNIEYGCSGRISCTCYQQLAVKDFGDVKNKFFLRMQVENCPGVLAQIAKVFGEHKVSIARVVQKNAKTDRAELVIVTEKVKEKHMGSALCELKEMKSIFEVSSMIREY